MLRIGLVAKGESERKKLKKTMRLVQKYEAPCPLTGSSVFIGYKEVDHERLQEVCAMAQMSGAMLASYGGKISIGDDVSFNPGVIGHGGVSIGSRTRIAARTLTISANHFFANPDLPIMSQGLTCKGITVGCDVWLGPHVVVLDGVTIGDGCVVGAGAVITKSLPPFSIAAGVPVKIIGKRVQLPEGQVAVDAHGEISTLASDNRKNGW
jgi:acetyltransferase-like isoleucine patch superfamily enzyme